MSIGPDRELADIHEAYLVVLTEECRRLAVSMRPGQEILHYPKPEPDPDPVYTLNATELSVDAAWEKNRWGHD